MHRVALTLTLAIPLLSWSLAARADGSAAPAPASVPPPVEAVAAPSGGESSAAAPPEPLVYKAPHVVLYEGGRIPSNAHIEGRLNTKLVTPGLAVAGAMYGFSLLYALGTCGAQTACRSGSAWLYVPVIGPFFTAAQAPTSGGAALSVFDGAVQTLGAAVFLAGLAMPKQVVVWEDDSVALKVAPAPMPGGAGIVLSLAQL